VRAFAQAVADGDLEGLVAVLDPAVVSTSDGGRRAVAARKPLHGADRVRSRHKVIADEVEFLARPREEA